MLMGQMIVSALLAALAAGLALANGHGVLLALLMYWTVGSLSLVTMAMALAYGYADPAESRSDR